MYAFFRKFPALGPANILRRTRLYSGVVDNLPSQVPTTTTGQGPFVDMPQIKPLKMGGLMSLQVPESATLNLRQLGVVCLNGGYDDLRSTIRHLGDDIWYQEVRAGCPTTIFLSDANSKSTQYLVVEIKRKEGWKIYKPKSLAAWSGQDLSFSWRTDHRSKSIELRGTGVIVVRSSGRISRIELQEDESFLTHPQTILATSATMGSNTLIPKDLSIRDDSVSSPRFGGWQGFIHRRLAVVSGTLDELNDRKLNWLSAQLLRLTSKVLTTLTNGVVGGNDKYVKISGPGCILLTNSYH